MSDNRLIRTETVRIRRPHQCFGCLQTIPVGVEAIASTCTGDGAIFTNYFCEPCWEFVKEYPDLCCDDDGFMDRGCVADAREENKKFLEESK